MRVLLKDGRWVRVDTSYLFNNQYNLAGIGRRVYDREIECVEDDERKGLGKCSYCGTVVAREPGRILNGEPVPTAEEHFAQREAMPCNSCRHYRITKLEQDAKSEDSPVDENGVFTRVITTTEKWGKKCNESPCINHRCREYGVMWFTEDNTFFLRYPNGLPKERDFLKLRNAGFVYPHHGATVMGYPKKIGTYELYAEVELKNGHPVCVTNFVARNHRTYLSFFIEGDHFMVRARYSNQWEPRKNLGIPADVQKKIRKICTL